MDPSAGPGSTLDFTSAVVVTAQHLTRPERKAVQMLVDVARAVLRLRFGAGRGRHGKRGGVRLR